MNDDFASWVGRRVTRHDVVTPRLVHAFEATLAPFLFKPANDGDAAPGLHWALAPAMPAMAELGPDGAEVKGLFLPPIALPRRLWAGGTIESFATFRAGMKVGRISTLSDVKMRHGKAGQMCFLSVTHEFQAGQTILLRERQDLVFRGGRPKLSEPAAEESLPPPDLEWKVEASAPLLFRFSALTFNAHRIHYDHPYAVQHEGYAGLVVHGPLQAALLLNQSAVLLGKLPARFDYRCTAPLIAGQTIRVASHRTQAGAAGRIIDGDGIVTIESTALDRETTAA